MSLNFCILAGNALTCPLCDVFGHVGPDKTCRNETTCVVDAWMAIGVDVMENLLLKLRGNERTKCFGGHITQKRKLWRQQNGCDVERWRTLQYRDGLACLLCLGNVSVGERQGEQLRGYGRRDSGCCGVSAVAG